MPRRGVVSGLWSVLGARHSLALRPWRHRPHLSLQSGPRRPGPRWDTPDAVFLQLLCSDGPWRRERSSADGWPGPKFCPSHARRGVSASQSGAQDTGAQLLGPSVAPLPPWGRPGKADPVSPSCGPPHFLPGPQRGPSREAPMVLSPLAGSLLLTSGSPPAPRRHQGALPTEF